MGHGRPLTLTVIQMGTLRALYTDTRLYTGRLLSALAAGGNASQVRGQGRVTLGLPMEQRAGTATPAWGVTGPPFLPMGVGGGTLASRETSGPAWGRGPGRGWWNPVGAWLPSPAGLVGLLPRSPVSPLVLLVSRAPPLTLTLTLGGGTLGGCLLAPQPPSCLGFAVTPTGSPVLGMGHPGTQGLSVLGGGRLPALLLKPFPGHSLELPAGCREAGRAPQDGCGARTRGAGPCGHGTASLVHPALQPGTQGPPPPAGPPVPSLACSGAGGTVLKWM